jgi:hypothetical protein
VSELVTVVLVLAVWFVVSKYLLPKLGIPT